VRGRGFGQHMIDYETLKRIGARDVEHRYGVHDTILYALGLGWGADPLDRRELPYLYEGAGPRVLPTMAVVLGYPGFWLKEPGTGVDWVRVLHGEQRLQIHRPLPPSGVVIGRTRVTGITDKGAGNGAILVTERRVENETGELLAVNRQVTLLRGDGGYSASGHRSDPAPEPLPPVPDRAPDTTIATPVCPRLALIYRLSGDLNPLHADPDVARAAGFERPILHGLATFGIAARALIVGLASGDAQRLTRIDARFSAPAYPGDLLETDAWEEGSLVRFRTRAPQRGAVVLDRGLAELESD
jgi:acyl dehydratase